MRICTHRNHASPRRSRRPAQWNIKGYPALVTDTASSLTMGGSSKIGTVQNLLLLSAELHGPWADYDFGVDPDVGHPSLSTLLDLC